MRAEITLISAISETGFSHSYGPDWFGTANPVDSIIPSLVTFLGPYYDYMMSPTLVALRLIKNLAQSQVNRLDGDSESLPALCLQAPMLGAICITVFKR